MEFRVWSPLAEKVEIEVLNETRPMQRDALTPGWWSLEVPQAAHGADYAYRINGGSPLPDPRSPWQPGGVHKSSRVVDHSRFEWTDEHWQARPLGSAVIYELHIGTFTPEGTFDAAIEKLDHLVELGVTHVELLPVADFQGSRGWGYDGVALFAVKEAYGGPEALKRLVNACHAKHLAVVMDVVYNHLGPTGNYLGQFGPYFTDRHHTPWGAAINFDSSYSDEVRRFFCDNALMWLRDYHIDGLRLDAVHAIIDTSAIHFLEQLAAEVDELKAHLGRHLVLIAESDLNDPRVVRRWEIGGFGIDAQWSDDFHHALHTTLTGERSGYYADFGELSDLGRALCQPYVYAGRHSKFRRRRHGRPAQGLSGTSFLCYLQNHDQLGNRAQGERISHLVNLDRAKIGAALVLTAPYVPMLFQGEEWAASSPFQYFVDFADEPELAKAVTEGRRHEFSAFGWEPDEVPDPQDEATFLRSKIKWDEIREADHASMFAWHRKLIRLRKALSSLSNGRLELVQPRWDAAQQWLALERDEVDILCNFSNHEVRIPLAGDPREHVLLASKPGVELRDGAVRLPPECVAILGDYPGDLDV